MSFTEEFENLKKELKNEWIKYYSENADILAKLEIDKGEKWKSEKYQENYTLPRSEVILSVLLALRPDLKKELDFFAETITVRGAGRYNIIVKKLGLSFHVKKELEQKSLEI